MLPLAVFRLPYFLSFFPLRILFKNYYIVRRKKLQKLQNVKKVQGITPRFLFFNNFA
jgi:hypothetical protein